MKVILLSDIAKLGRKYDVKDVNSGYGQNFLIPKKLALAATKSALDWLNNEKSKTETENTIKKNLLIKNLVDLDGKTISIKEKANEKGHLFAGLHKEEIAKHISGETRIEIDPKIIVLKEPIKEIGKYAIEVSEAGKTIKFDLVVEGD